MSASVILASQSDTQATMWEWLDRAVPHSLVELAVSSAQLCTLSSELLRSGWQGLLLEGNAAFYAHLHDSWKNSPGVVCRMVDFSGDLEIARVLAEASITSEFGVLILNELNLVSGNLEQVWQAGFRPWIVVFQEYAEATIDRLSLYELLGTNGYRFAGLKDRLVVWTRLDALPVENRSAAPELRWRVVHNAGRSCFDSPTTDGHLTAAGHSDLLVSGWAVLEDPVSVPPFVYIEATDMRTSKVHYIQCQRYPRLDVSRHFGKPELLNSGFRSVVPMSKDHPSGLVLRIVQCDGDTCYRSPAQLLIERGILDFELNAREGLAKKYLRGAGIEIGALQRKLSLPSQCAVRYIDRMSVPDLLHHYPELQSFPLQTPDIVDDGERLDYIAGSSLDFVVANHFFEHSENPIRTLQNLLRVLKPGGVLFMAIPDKRYTFDSERPSTQFSTLLATYHSGVRGDRREMYSEWVRFVEMNQSSDIDTRIKELISTKYSIHFNVWSAHEVFEFFILARQHVNLPFSIAAAVSSDNEEIVLLERSFEST